jgi:hypothetical protein
MLLFKGKLTLISEAFTAEMPANDTAEAVPSERSTFLLEVLFFIIKID